MKIVYKKLRLQKVVSLCKVVLPVFVLVNLIFFILSARTQYKGINLDNPKDYEYRGDGMIFLKTYYLLKSNSNFYDTYRQATGRDNSKRQLKADVFTWRLPTIFYFWRLFAINGYQILIIYWILAFLFLLSIFFLLKRLSGIIASWLGVILILPYFAGNLWYKDSFLFTEWWSLFFFIIGLTFFIYKKYRVAWFILLFSVLIRELILIPLICFLIWSLLEKRNRLFFTTIVAIFIIFFVLHYSLVISSFNNNRESMTTFNLLLHRFHPFVRLGFLRMTAFSFWSYPFIKFRVNLILFVIGLVSLLKYLVSHWEKLDDKFYIYISSWSFLLVLPFITSSLENDYWGILFMPILLITVPFLTDMF